MLRQALLLYSGAGIYENIEGEWILQVNAAIASERTADCLMGKENDKKIKNKNV